MLIALLVVLIVLATGVWLYLGLVGRYEYLAALSSNEWKSGEQIREEMAKLKGRRFGLREVYRTLRSLVEDGLVEERADAIIRRGKLGIQVKVHEFRLTKSGISKKRELEAILPKHIDLGTPT